MGITGNWDGRISRRTLLRTGGSAAAGLVMFGRSALAARAAPPFAAEPFTLGVASGDPTPDGIVLWTRLAPEPLADGGGMPPEVYGMRYELAADDKFTRIVRRGGVEALPEEVHTVHVDVRGLEPATEYWYRFKWGTAVSPVGRTRTAPAADAAPAALDFAFVSCQAYSHGLYPAYADLARQDLELVVHLGDYIYEGPGLTGVRRHEPAREIKTLADYRTRYAQYKTDGHLQAAHAAFPWLMTWDDHEFKNNYADLDLDPNEPLDTVAERRAAAYLAYWEHSPLSRSRKPVGKDMNLYRRLRWGGLTTFHVLDTRQHRADQIDACAASERDPSGYCPAALDPSRSILGAEQRDWLLDGLGTSGTAWNVLANQVPFAPWERDPSPDIRRFDRDQWDGYVADRQLVLDFLAERKLLNAIAITGDSHIHSARNVPRDFRALDGPVIATEFIGSAISSDGDPANPTSTFGGDANNPHFQFTNRRKGYVKVLVEPSLWTNEFRVVETITDDEAPAWTEATFVVPNGSPGAVRV